MQTACFSESRLRSGYPSVFVSGNDFQLLPLTREILSTGGRLSVCFSGCSANGDLFVFSRGHNEMAIESCSVLSFSSLTSLF